MRAIAGIAGSDGDIAQVDAGPVAIAPARRGTLKMLPGGPKLITTEGRWLLDEAIAGKDRPASVAELFEAPAERSS